MATYISLLRFTSQGVQRMKSLPDMLDMNRTGFGTAMDVKIKELYLLTGQYDALAILEAPNDEALARFVLTIGSFGNVRTETCRAFTEAESLKLVEALP